MKPWLSCHDGHVRLTLHVQPGAKKTEAAGEHGECLKLRLAAPPVDGKANAALLAWLADRFGVAKRDVELLSGDKSRHKVVRIACGLDAAEALDRLGFH
ncbi:DUF167 domain-containing protein [Chromobacterium violaceum]|uniref:UPF0235 protein CBW21_02590 n=1 Tax=Chromobacterium violaceum TaxID=536 RepID=A0A1R0ME19_CHRVL|nr:DUF167 domain-containing protein [Chromobacterium violaceum]ATP30430.1 YggU family protein [Chromobacterium violaceum]ATP34338.1 YggU family protein [Chromobacterium violaceum]KJH69134.1 hypothetical protein UF16_00315 [Chromobacterium violaceum]KMN51435.1 hypothetical protein VK93_01105 [Chromobacterium violaceum]KMN86905.1 hypothetical protein VL02_07205 [Chromobacterium violaceum]